MSIRFGAYGDPYALPIDILTSIKSYVKNNTSYTHQWQQGNDALKKISMASVDSIIEAKVAQKNGWRTFRVTNDINTLMDSEIKIRVSTDQRDIRAEIFVSDFLKNLEAFPKVLPTLTKIPLLVGSL